MNSYHSSLIYFDFLMKGRNDASTGNYIIDDNKH